MRNRRNPEILSTIIYTDGRSGEVVERKELTAISNVESDDDGDNTDESTFCAIRSIRLAKDSSGNKSKFGEVSTNSSEINNFHNTRYGKKLDGSLLANVSGVSQHSRSDSVSSVTPKPVLKKSEKSILLSVIQLLGVKNCFPPSKLKTLKEDCLKIKDFDNIFVFLKALLKALNLPSEESVTTRSRSHPTEKDVKYLINKNKALEDKLKAMVKNIKTLQIAFNRKGDELKRNSEKQQRNSEVVAELRIKNEKLEEEIGICEDKYKNLTELLEMKNSEIKQLQFLYQELVKHTNERNANGCEDCKKLKNKINELNTICHNSEKLIADLKFRNQDLDKKEDHARNEVEELEKEVKELKFKLFTETSAKPETKADRMAVMSYYFSCGEPEPPLKKDPNPERKGPMEEPHQLQRDHYAYNEPSTSDSVCNCPRCSFHYSLAQTKSVGDYLIAVRLTEDKFVESDSSSDNDLESYNSHSYPAKKLKK